MFAPALRIAIAKTAAPAQRLALERALLEAESLGRIESGFEAKINASKASRGEKPTKLSKARREQLSGYSGDATALQAQQLAAFEDASSGVDIVAALKAGLDSDLQFWAGAAKYTHAADMPVVQEFVDAKRSLQAALAACLDAIVR